MPGAGAIKAGEAYVEVGADTAPLKRKMAGLRGMLKGMGQAFAKMAKVAVVAFAAIGAAVAGVMRHFMKYGDDIAKMARRTGFSTEALSELSHAAKLTGSSLENVEKATKRMARSIIDGTEGMAEYTRAFEQLGLDLEELRTMSPEEAFLKIGFAIGGIKDPLLQASTAQDIFGRAGTQLIPMFKEGEERIAAYRKEAVKLGISMSADTALKAEELTDAMQRLKSGVSGVALAFATEFAGGLTDAADSMTEMTISAREWGQDWRIFVLEAKSYWITFVATLANTWDEMKFGFNNLWTWLSTGFTLAVHGIMELFDGLLVGLMKGINWVAGQLNKLGLELGTFDVAAFEADRETLRSKRQAGYEQGGRDALAYERELREGINARMVNLAKELNEIQQAQIDTVLPKLRKISPNALGLEGMAGVSEAPPAGLGPKVQTGVVGGFGVLGAGGLAGRAGFQMQLDAQATEIDLLRRIADNTEQGDHVFEADVLTP